MADYFPRVQEVVLPILREAFPDVQVSSWIPDIDYRKYPVINVRRLGGYRSRSRPFDMDKPVIELTVYHSDGLPEAEAMYAECLDALFRAHASQREFGRGRLSFVKETMGMTQFSSLFQDNYRVQGLIQVGVRPLRKEP